ncbi:C39 family peptidase [Paenibacillus hamazuiensis]|uniref:C39 family peptidase n=1 Tax=Paenibacillus hamazuiensis TaxID=2936508 RepID=UPI00201013A0|nr:C39 family peptidase [Paenibacillus hamazuiensis]
MVRVLWAGMKVTFGFFLIVGLLFASGVFTLLLYAKYTGKELFAAEREVSGSIAYAETAAGSNPPTAKAQTAPAAPDPAPKKSNMIDAPLIRQKPELPSGCEITSLTMLLQFYGVKKSKMELLPEMKVDKTPLVRGKDGSIISWGNPNLGFVGDATGQSGRGFGIYHTALADLLKKYVPTAVDLTRQPFEKVEQQILNGIPVVAWTTIDYRVPSEWVIWDTPIGPIQTTFMEHAVLVVGVDEEAVYVNDPLSEKAKQRIDKDQFIATWEAMGRQALSYNK